MGQSLEGYSDCPPPVSHIRPNLVLGETEEEGEVVCIGGNVGQSCVHVCVVVRLNLAEKKERREEEREAGWGGESHLDVKSAG